VIHLAARAGVRPSIEQPRLYEQLNVAGTVNLLILWKEFREERLIFGSSSSVYGATSRAPFSEDQAGLRPISPYAATKLACELLCYTYAHLYKLPVMALRFFTVYGPRQRPDLAIHKFVTRIETGKPLGGHLQGTKAARLPAADLAGGRAQEICGVVPRRRPGAAHLKRSNRAKASLLPGGALRRRVC
jgi:UDP-glucuronate 4-epimerase